MRGARETTSRAPSLHSRPGSGSAGAQRHSPHPIQDRRAIPLPGSEDRGTGASISVVVHNAAVDPRKSPSLDRTRRPPPDHHLPALKSPAGPALDDRQVVGLGGAVEFSKTDADAPPGGSPLDGQGYLSLIHI